MACMLRLKKSALDELEPLPDDVVLINLSACRVWLRDGEEVTVTNVFVGQTEVEPDGTDEEINALVAGPMKDGKWLSVDLRQYEPLEMN